MTGPADSHGVHFPPLQAAGIMNELKHLEIIGYRSMIWKIPSYPPIKLKIRANDNELIKPGPAWKKSHPLMAPAAIPVDQFNELQRCRAAVNAKHTNQSQVNH